ncbi:glycine betaine ABC transporter substrate-binding protein [Nakamurella lactea]|uniref:glycine betaine ABC transporter substrate-binding protein n=1 Tax=Nakamurella lactea TaxID=459515 RepID=UPI00041B87F6|nr:glycine betaine ABC transporter substrate-binding protein [Nakamurella lactea]
MQSKKLRFLAVALAGAVAMSVAACGSRDDDSSGSSAADAAAGGSESTQSSAAGGESAGSSAAGSGAASGAAGSSAAGSGAAGAGAGSIGADEDTNITIAYIPWDEDVAVTHLWKKVLEDKGYTVKMQQLEVSPTFDAVANDKADLFFDVWLPVTHAPQWAKYKDKVEDLGTWYDQATLNIAVPTYMKDVNTIADLKNVADQVDGKIVGIESGAGLTRVTKEMLAKYGFDDLDLQTSSTSAMLAALEKATKAEDPIVVTLWHPHWAYSAYPIKDLEDPDGVMGDKEQIHVIGNQGFAADHPMAAAMLKNFTLSDEQLADLENEVLIKNKSNPDAGVDAWLQNNQELIDGLSK